MTNRLIYLALALFLGVTILVNCDTTKRSASVQGETTRFDGNPLALYGEALYESAACNNCHTQQIANLDVQLVSLDGVGGKYPNSWLYYYLFDPEGIKAHAEMPSYAELYTTPLEESVLQRKLQEGGWEAQQESLWEELLDQAESLTKELRSQDVSIPQTEILALMAYVQQIPSSKQKQLLEQAELAEERRKEEIWEEVGLDSSSVILKVAQQVRSISQGHTLFKGRCAVCHGIQGEGGVGPNLTDEYWLHGGQPTDIARTIVYGVPEKGMISWRFQLTPTEVGELVAYVRSIRGTNPPNAKDPQGQKQ